MARTGRPRRAFFSGLRRTGRGGGGARQGLLCVKADAGPWDGSLLLHRSLRPPLRLPCAGAPFRGGGILTGIALSSGHRRGFGNKEASCRCDAAGRFPLPLQNHDKIGQQDAPTLHLLFLHRPVASFFKKAPGGEGDVHKTVNRHSSMICCACFCLRPLPKPRPVWQCSMVYWKRPANQLPILEKKLPTLSKKLEMELPVLAMPCTRFCRDSTFSIRTEVSSFSS